MPEMPALPDRLRAAAAGRVEWQIVSPDGGICMWFSTSGPEARKWLQEHQRDYPERFQGHKVERQLVQTERDRLMIEAADALVSALSVAEAAVAAERAAIIALLPGGDHVDPQWVADAIRARGAK